MNINIIDINNIMNINNNTMNINNNNNNSFGVLWY